MNKILVINSTANLTGAIRNVVETSAEVNSAPDAVTGIEKAEQEIPDLIVIGYLGHDQSVFELYKQLRRNWIARHSSILIVEFSNVPDAHKLLTEEERQRIDPRNYLLLTNPAEGSYPLDELARRIKIALDEKLKKRSNLLKDAIIDPNTFCISWEQAAGKGAFEVRQEQILENARIAGKAGKIHAISVTDNPGGSPAIASDTLCAEIRRAGIESLVHIAFRDKNRNQIESTLYQLAALGIRNLLLLTGDYPSGQAFEGTAKPVFDMDSVHGLQMVSRMNKGLVYEYKKKRVVTGNTDFFAGVAFSPFKKTEAEVLLQYYKLTKKINSGADFIFTQVGYDARKLHELMLWMKVNSIRVPVLETIYVLTYPMAKIMHSNKVPGCIVTDKLLAQMAEEEKNSDRGKMASFERAAKMYAIAKGINFAGVSISSQGLDYSSVDYIIQRGEELVPNWHDLVHEFDYPQEDGFYYLEQDAATGLNLEKQSPRLQKPARPLIFGFSKLIHGFLFNPSNLLFKILRPVAEFVDSRSLLKHAFGSFEHIIKVMLFDCMNCGDCALFDVAYLCPMSQCPKNQRNGACGGSYNGWCEVYPNEKQCIWVKAYLRGKGTSMEQEIQSTIVPPCNWNLQYTSSWLNFYLGRDHFARRLNIKPPQKKRS